MADVMPVFLSACLETSLYNSRMLNWGELACANLYRNYINIFWYQGFIGKLSVRHLVNIQTQYNVLCLYILFDET